MRYFKVTSLPKFRLKQRKFLVLKIRIKWVKTEKSGQNLWYDRDLSVHLFTVSMRLETLTLWCISVACLMTLGRLRQVITKL